MADSNKAGTGGGGGRIAIKFGASSSSSSAKPNAPPSSLGKRPRPAKSSSHAFGGADSDSDSDDDRRHRGKHEAITGFGADGAETERKKRAEEQAKKAKKEYVIARQPNRDWRDEIKASRGASNKNILPAEARAAKDGTTTVDTAPADQDSGIKWGLTVKEKRADDEKQDDKDGALPDTQKQQDDTPAAPPKPQTADDEAMDALLGKRPSKEDKVIVTEDDAYSRDVDAAGAASTLADYEAMPVEEFGAALLRGMGWDGQPRGAKQKEVRRRQNRLGLGAKELDGAEDLGGWNQKGGKTGPGGKKRPPRLADYRREEEKKKEERRGGREDSYKRERERERGSGGYGHRDRERERDGHRHGGHRDGERERDRDGHRDRDRHRGYDRDRRR